jgi:hypothetical protein
VLLLAGCGDDAGTSGPSSAAVEDVVVERLGADQEQAACIGDRWRDAFDAGELRTVVDEGLAGLPQARWGDYLDAVAVCLVLEPDER